MEEYSLLYFEDRMIKSVTTEHRLPLPMYVWMYIQGPHLPVAVDAAANSSNLRPPLEVCLWGKSKVPGEGGASPPQLAQSQALTGVGIQKGS